MTSLTELSTATDSSPTTGQTYADATSFPSHARAYMMVAATVREAGLMRRAPLAYAAIGVGLGAAFAACIAGFILLGPSWFQLLIAFGLGLCFTHTAFLAHEAAHRQILSSGPSNDKLARVLASVVGVSYSWWDSKHSRHHGNPNKIGKDPDIASDTISFVAEEAAKTTGLTRFIVQRQGWLFFPLLTLEGVNLHVQGFKYLFTEPKVKGRASELAMLAARFVIVLTPIFWVLPLGMAFAFLGVQLAVFGVYMGATFAPNHKGMPIIAPTAKLEFFSKQVRTSRNISGGWVATWLMGGLNYQIEHHLFPSMPRRHLAKTSVIVREFCQANNIPYTETTVLQSYGIVIRYLNRVGLAARDPFDCPLAAQFGRR